MDLADRVKRLEEKVFGPKGPPEEKAAPPAEPEEAPAESKQEKKHGAKH